MRKLDRWLVIGGEGDLGLIRECVGDDLIMIYNGKVIKKDIF